MTAREALSIGSLFSHVAIYLEKLESAGAEDCIPLRSAVQAWERRIYLRHGREETVSPVELLEVEAFR